MIDLGDGALAAIEPRNTLEEAASCVQAAILVTEGILAKLPGLSDVSKAAA